LKDDSAISNSDLLRDERNQMSCFEKCLGKHSDSFEVSLGVFGAHLRATKDKKNLVTHAHIDGTTDKDTRFLLGEGVEEPVYDTPMSIRKN
jgi:hypothetical protein